MQAGNTVYRDLDDVPAVVPVFPLSGALLLPGSQLPLNLFEPRYLAMFDAALKGALAALPRFRRPATGAISSRWKASAASGSSRNCL
jgi:hypothetical protein